MGRLGMGELILLFAVLLLLFGATRLPQLGSSLGSAIRNFKRGFSGDDDAGPIVATIFVRRSPRWSRRTVTEVALSAP